jgi:hypothetical protein
MYYACNGSILDDDQPSILAEVPKLATNPPSGDGHRNGAVCDRSQAFNPKTQTWVKRDDSTGRFMGQKRDGTPFKGVRKEN